MSVREAESASLAELYAMQAAGDLPSFDGGRRRTGADRAKNCAARRAALIARLGGECVECAATEQLEFDHRAPRTWVARELSRWARIARYEREAAAGVLQLLCRGCNGHKGRPGQRKGPRRGGVR